MTTSVYIHIPFCKTICNYCDFCKMYYQDNWANLYLDSLSNEIDKYYAKEKIKTLYIGGGTPNSLNNEQLIKLFEIINQKISFDNDYEYTIECNIELLTLEQIKLFKKYGINRVSIGIQTFNDKNLKFLGRNHTQQQVTHKIKQLKENGIKNINIDLIYALPNQTLKELEEDIKLYKQLDIPHISTYSLIIEPNTVLYNKKIKNIDEDLDSDMYNIIIDNLKEYKHYETSNFATAGYESKHNLNYWNNEHYYGFGLGASGYIDNIRYDNTRSLNKYLDGSYRNIVNTLSKNEIIENEFLLGFRKLEGINIEKFKLKYNFNVLDIPIVKNMLAENKIINTGYSIKINDKHAYTANRILIEFLGVDYEK